MSFSFSRLITVLFLIAFSMSLVTHIQDGDVVTSIVFGIIILIDGLMLTLGFYDKNK
jgi:hypothetical protein